MWEHAEHCDKRPEKRLADHIDALVRERDEEREHARVLTLAHGEEQLRAEQAIALLCDVERWLPLPPDLLARLDALLGRESALSRSPARVVRDLVASACDGSLAPARLVLEVPGLVPRSLNVFMGRSRWAWRGEKGRWVHQLGQAWMGARLRGGTWPRSPQRPVRVTIERITARENALDPDNAIGACKPLLDALRALELLADDTVAAVSLTVRQPREPKTRRTRITLEMD